MTIEQFTSFLESKYPLEKAQPWDNTGLMFNTKAKTIKNIIVALDLSTEVMDFAIKNKIDLIVIHHPFVWSENQKKDFFESPYKESIFRKLENTGIALYTSHTNFDAATDGMGDTIIKMLGFKPLEIPGATFGRMFKTSIKISKLEGIITKKIGISKFVSNIKDKEFASSKIAILPGAGTVQDMIAADKMGANMIYTSDIKWSTWVTIKELGINVTQVTHAMEDVFTHKISKMLSEEFDDVNVFPVFSQEIAK